MRSPMSSQGNVRMVYSLRELLANLFSWLTWVEPTIVSLMYLPAFLSAPVAAETFSLWCLSIFLPVQVEILRRTSTALDEMLIMFLRKSWVGV